MRKGIPVHFSLPEAGDPQRGEMETAMFDFFGHEACNTDAPEEMGGAHGSHGFNFGL